MMYSFRNTVEKQKKDRFLPTSAMVYDGFLLEEVIEGYQTLSISGREMLSLEIESEDQRMGSRITKQHLPARVLTVNYQLRNDNPQQLLVNYRCLMEYLYREVDVPIYFQDELDVSYYGRYSTSEEVPGDSYMFVSSFEIICSDPFKYSSERQSHGEIFSRLPYPIKPDRIQVLLERNNSLRITNGEATISLTSTSIKIGDQVEVDFQAGIVYVNGKNRTSLLDLTSDFENFYLKQDQTVYCDNGKMTIYYREMVL